MVAIREDTIMQMLAKTASVRNTAAPRRTRRGQDAAVHTADFNDETRRAILEAHDGKNAMTFSSVVDALAYLHADV